MSFEAITAISRAEADAKAAVSEAEAFAKRSLAEAEEAGRKLVEAAGVKANHELAEQKLLAEKEAMEKADELLAQTDEQKAALKAKAEMRLTKAAAVVMERIVNS